jgi:CoA-transferase family III
LKTVPTPIGRFTGGPTTATSAVLPSTSRLTKAEICFINWLRAQFLIESDNPGYLAERRLGCADLAACNRTLIYVSITPFGQDDPKAAYADSDLVIFGAGGPLLLYGDETGRRFELACRRPIFMPVVTPPRVRWSRSMSASAQVWDSTSMWRRSSR